MWRHPWGYKEGWTISTGLFTVGLIWQLVFGKIEIELFTYPVSLIAGALFVLLTASVYILSRKVIILRWFAGAEASITAIASFLILVIVMGLTRQVSPDLDLPVSGWMRTGFMQMTVSRPFLLMFLYLLFVLGLTISKRLARFKLNGKNVCFLLNHIGLYLALWAALWGSGDLQRLKMTATVGLPEWRAYNEKNALVELPLAIELNTFAIEEYPPKLMFIDNQTGKTSRNFITVEKDEGCAVHGEGYTVKGERWDIELVTYLPEAACLITPDTLGYTPFDGEGNTTAVYVKAKNSIDGTQREGWVSCGNFRFPYHSLRLNDEFSLIMPEREPKSFASDVTVYTKEGETQKALIKVNKPLSVNGWKIYQLNYDETMGKWSRSSGFELVRDTWLPVVYAGFLMMVAGAVCLFVLAPQKKEE